MMTEDYLKLTSFHLIPALLLLAEIICFVMLGIRRRKNENNDKVLRVLAIVGMVISALIAALAFVSNFGGIRFVLILLSIPFIQAALFWVANILSSRFLRESKAIFILYIISCITNFAMYAFLPDGTDSGPMYAMFFAIRSDDLAVIMWSVAVWSFITNVGACIAQIVLYASERRKISAKTKMEPEMQN